MPAQRRQTISENAAGATGANDDEVECLKIRHGFPSHQDRKELSYSNVGFDFAGPVRGRARCNHITTRNRFVSRRAVPPTLSASVHRCLRGRSPIFPIPHSAGWRRRSGNATKATYQILLTPKPDVWVWHQTDLLRCPVSGRYERGKRKCPLHPSKTDFDPKPTWPAHFCCGAQDHSRRAPEGLPGNPRRSVRVERESSQGRTVMCLEDDRFGQGCSVALLLGGIVTTLTVTACHPNRVQARILWHRGPSH